MAEKTTSSQKSQNNSASNNTWAAVFTAGAVLIFAVSGWAWWHYVRSNPERTFYGAIEDSLQTSGITKRVTQTSGDQKLDQIVTLQVGGQNVAHGQTTITQDGDVKATIKTETISKPKEDHVRYTAIQTNQKSQSGQDLDFSKLIGIWGRAGEGDATQNPGELYNETVMGVVPVGNLPAANRKEIMKFVKEKDVYSIDSKATKRVVENGRPVYTYEVTVAPEAYIGMLKLFGVALGMKQFESIDPASYKDTQPLTFQVKVDVWGRHVTAITFEGGERTETASGFGIIKRVDTPKDAIPLEELQSRLQEVQ